MLRVTTPVKVIPVMLALLMAMLALCGPGAVHGEPKQPEGHIIELVTFDFATKTETFTRAFVKLQRSAEETLVSPSSAALQQTETAAASEAVEPEVIILASYDLTRTVTISATAVLSESVAPVQADNRKKVADTMQYPSSIVVRLDHNNQRWGTGGYYGINVVQTVAHALYLGNGQWVHPKVIPAATAGSEPLGHCFPKAVTVSSAWVTSIDADPANPDHAYDYGVIATCNSKAGWFGMETVPAGFSGTVLHQLMYPGDFGGDQASADGEVTSQTYSRLELLGWTLPGSSGAPEFDSRPDGPYIRAIHWGHFVENGDYYGASVPMNPRVFEFLVAAREKHKPPVSEIRLPFIRR